MARSPERELQKIKTAIAKEKKVLKGLEKEKREAQHTISHAKNAKQYSIKNKKLVDEIRRRQKEIQDQLSTLRQTEKANEKLLSKIEKERPQFAEDKAKLIKERSLLAQDKKEHQKLLKDATRIKKALDHNQELVELIKARQVDLKKQRAGVDEDKITLDKIRKEIYQQQQKINRQLSVAKVTADKIDTKQSELQTQQKELSKYRREIASLGKQKQIMTDRQKHLDELEKSLGDKEGVLSKKEKEQQLALKQVRNIQKLLEQQQSESEKLTEKRNQLATEKKELLALKNQNRKSASDLETIKKQMAILKRKEEDLSSRELALSETLKQSGSKRSDLAVHLAELRKAKDELKSERDLILPIKEDIQQRVVSFQATLQERTTAIDKATKETRTQLTEVKQLVTQDLGLLQNKEKQVYSMVQQLEKDSEHVDSKRAEIERLQHSLEKEQRLIQSKQSYYDGQEKELLKREEHITLLLERVQDEKNQLEREQKRADRAQELIEQLPQLEQRYQSISSELRSLESKHFTKTVDPLVSAQVLRSKAETLAELENELVSRTSKLVSKSSTPSQMRQLLKDGSLQEEIEKLRTLVAAGNMDTATVRAARMDLILAKVKDKNKKKLLEYELQLIKNNIKLARLA
jgi:nucleoprotein TPR